MTTGNNGRSTFVRPQPETAASPLWLAFFWSPFTPGYAAGKCNLAHRRAFRYRPIAHGLACIGADGDKYRTFLPAFTCVPNFPESADCNWVLPRQMVTDGVETTARVRHIARRRSCGLAAPGARSSRRCRLIYGLIFSAKRPKRPYSLS